MGISAISATNSYSSISSGRSQSNVEQLKLDEQKLQQELKQLKVKSSGKSNQVKEKTLEQEISKIEQKIRQAEDGSTSFNTQPVQGQNESLNKGSTSELNQLA